jgi:hypothetical protein
VGFDTRVQGNEVARLVASMSSRKLWIMWAVLAVTTVLVGIITDNFPITMGFAVATAAAGWAAFLVSE